MRLTDFWSKWQERREAARFRRHHPEKPSFECPGCGYVGPFRDMHPATGLRLHAQCPGCLALERQRLQLLVLQSILSRDGWGQKKLLHFAPEPVLKEFFDCRVGAYHTADLLMHGVDCQADLLSLPFCDGAYDMVFASHVLEHVADDHKAIREIYRVLKPGGIAILPVPVVTEKTIEYPGPNAGESGHVRAPGLDYFGRFEKVFTRVELYSSSDFADKYQLYVYEHRKAQSADRGRGDRHPDFVPVCHKLRAGVP